MLTNIDQYARSENISTNKKGWDHKEHIVFPDHSGDKLETHNWKIIYKEIKSSPWYPELAWHSRPQCKSSWCSQLGHVVLWLEKNNLTEYQHQTGSLWDWWSEARESTSWFCLNTDKNKVSVQTTKHQHLLLPTKVRDYCCFVN